METLRQNKINSIMRTISDSVDLLDAYFRFNKSGTQCLYKINELYFPSLHVTIDLQLNIRNIQ